MITKKQINEIYINITYNILNMDVVISKPNRKDKKLKAVIDDKKHFTLGLQATLIAQLIKNENAQQIHYSP